MTTSYSSDDDNFSSTLIDEDNEVQSVDGKPYIKCCKNINMIRQAERTTSFKFVCENFHTQEQISENPFIRPMIKIKSNFLVNYHNHMVPSSVTTDKPSFMPFSNKHFDMMENDETNGKFLFWKLKDVMNDKISSHFELQTRSKQRRKFGAYGFQQVYYLGVAYINGDDFFKIQNLRKRFPVRSIDDIDATFDDFEDQEKKNKNLDERRFLASFLDLLDDVFKTEESSLCVSEGKDDPEESESHKAFLHYANDEFGRGHLLKSISSSFLVGIYCDLPWDVSRANAYGFVSGCVCLLYTSPSPRDS